MQTNKKGGKIINPAIKEKIKMPVLQDMELHISSLLVDELKKLSFDEHFAKICLGYCHLNGYNYIYLSYDKLDIGWHYYTVDNSMVVNISINHKKERKNTFNFVKSGMDKIVVKHIINSLKKYMKIYE